MRYATILMVLLGAAVVRAGPLSQEEGRPPRPPAGGAEQEGQDEDQGGVLEKAVDLKLRVREMRKTVIGGGPSVEKAEKEALGFYRRKIQENAKRVDELLTTRDVKEAEYRVALDATLDAESGDAGGAARLASSLRAEITSVDQEIKDLERQRTALGNAAAAVRARIERRRRIVTHFDDVGSVEQMPFLGAEALGPDDDQTDGPDPFGDDAFLADLLARDPERARSILFDLDTVRYWKMFPLTPPEQVLLRAIPFPPPDFPGKR